MSFEKQVFISYAHIDNEPLTPNQQGWISRFHAALSAMLSMRLGRKAEIWRDVKLTGNDIFADEIIQQFPKTALLISVLTPRYVESEWCTREVKEFVKSAETTGGVTVDNKSRVLKVIKIPVDSENALPEVMKLALGYPFYIFDEQQTPLELDPAYGEEFTQKFNLKLAKLAFDVAELIKKMDTRTAAAEALSPGAEKPTVFVADCSMDHRDDREAVIADLRLHGYTTLADTQLPTEEASFIGELAGVLSRCKLSVHIIGSLYGVVPDGPSEKSVTVLENELAIEYCKIFGLKRIIWLPAAGIKSTSPRQQEFIDTLLRDPRAQLGADLITGDLEELKAAIHAALKKMEVPPPPPPVPQEPGEPGGKVVYIICDERDRKATIPLRKFLKSQGFESNIPAFDGDAATVRQSNQDMLAVCDAVIVFYGAGDDAWKRSIDADIRKSPGYRTNKPPLAPFTYLAEPSTADKTDLVDLEEPRLINCLQGFSVGALSEFVSTVTGKAKP